MIKVDRIEIDNNWYPPNCEKCYGCVHFGSMRRPFINNGDGTWKIGCKECTGYILKEETLIDKMVNYFYCWFGIKSKVK